MGLIPNTVCFWRKKMKKYEVAFNRASTPNHQSTAIVMANSKEEARAKFLRGNPNCKVVAVYEKK